MTKTVRGAAVGLLAALAAAGCKDPNAEKVAAMNPSNIVRVANLYAAYQNMVSAAGPKDEAEFKGFARAYAADKLKMMGIDPANVDAVFVSERDGQPFKIRYKVGGGRGSVDAVAFEAAGKDGKKQVAYTGGKVEEVDDATYASLWAGKGEHVAPGAAPTTQTGPKAGGRPGSGGPPPGAPTGPPGR